MAVLWASDLGRWYTDPLRAVWGQLLNRSMESAGGDWNTYRPTFDGVTTDDMTRSRAEWKRVGDVAWVFLELDDGGSTVVVDADFRHTLPQALVDAGIVAFVGVGNRISASNDHKLFTAKLDADNKVRWWNTLSADNGVWSGGADSVTLVCELVLKPSKVPVVGGPARGDAVVNVWTPGNTVAPVSFFRSTNDAVAPFGLLAAGDDDTQAVSQAGTARTFGKVTRRAVRLGRTVGVWQFDIQGPSTDATGTNPLEVDLPAGWVLNPPQQAVGQATVSVRADTNETVAVNVGTGVALDHDPNRVQMMSMDPSNQAPETVDGSGWTMNDAAFRATSGPLWCKLFDPVADVAWFECWDAEGALFYGQAYDSGDSVSPWPGEVAGYDLTEATNPPLYKANVGTLGGAAAVRFDASNDKITSGEFSPALDYTSGVTYVVVCEVEDTSSGQAILHGNESGASGNIEITSGSKWRLFAGTIADSSASVTVGAHLLVATFPGAGGGNSTLEVDGTQVVNANAGTEEIDQLRVGANDGGALNYDGAIHFVGVKEGALTSDEQTLLERWAGAKFGITVAGVSDTPASPTTDPEPDDEPFTTLVGWDHLWVAGVPPDTNLTYLYERTRTSPTGAARPLDPVRWWVDIDQSASTADRFKFKTVEGLPRLRAAEVVNNGVARPGLRFVGSDLLHVEAVTTIDGDAADWTMVWCSRRLTTDGDQGLWWINSAYAVGAVNGKMGIWKSDGTEVVAAAVTDTDPHVLIVTNDSTSTGTVSLYLDTYTSASDTAAATKFDFGDTTCELQLGRGFDTSGATVNAGLHTVFFAGVDASLLDATARQTVAEHARDVYGVTLS